MMKYMWYTKSSPTLLSANLVRHYVRPHGYQVSGDLIHDLESNIGMKIITEKKWWMH